jgi:hypothetical protein
MRNSKENPLRLPSGLYYNESMMRFMSANEIGLAWAAGFFDGEGCTSTRVGGNGKTYLRVSIGQKDRRALDRFAVTVGGCKVYGPSVRGIHQIMLGDSDARRVLNLLWPYMSEAKKEQAESKGYFNVEELHDDFDSLTAFEVAQLA